MKADATASLERHKKRFIYTILFFSTASIAAFLLEVIIGPGRLGVSEALHAFFHREGTAYNIVWNIRIPRATAAVETGVILGLSGLILQVALKNPLAEPYLLGVSGGASLGVMASLALFPSLGYLWMNIAGFIGALVAIAAVLVIGEMTGYSVYAVILAGVAMSALTASLSIIIYLTMLSAHRFSMLWLYGTLSLIGWRELPVITLAAIVVAGYTWLLRGHINILLLGDEQAASMGVDPSTARRSLILVSAAATALLTSYAGPIGFIGLMSPHISRLLVGSETGRMVAATIPVSVFLTTVSDLMARTLVPQGGEAPLGAMTALLGVPFFMYLVTRRYGEA
ncbi:MAG: iron ABC transporter permease [Desulfurococcales archaeon]|nr:iron ABC transporter permease [Desulfurococcales archaeon]